MYQWPWLCVLGGGLVSVCVGETSVVGVCLDQGECVCACVRACVCCGCKAEPVRGAGTVEGGRVCAG